jgi:predicted small lipoprotein YifL
MRLVLAAVLLLAACGKKGARQFKSDDEVVEALGTLPLPPGISY